MANSGYLVYLEIKMMRLKKDRLKDEARKRNLSQSGTKAKLVKRIIGGEIGGAEANLKTVKKNGIKISLVGPFARVRTRSQAAASKYFNYFNIVFENTYILFTKVGNLLPTLLFTLTYSLVSLRIKRCGNFNLSNLDFIPSSQESENLLLINNLAVHQFGRQT